MRIVLIFSPLSCARCRPLNLPYLGLAPLLRSFFPEIFGNRYDNVSVRQPTVIAHCVIIIISALGHLLLDLSLQLLS